METKQKLNHTVSNLKSDLKLFQSLFDYNEIRSASTGSSNEVIESNYIRVYGFRYWDEIEVYNLSEKVRQFNEKSVNCTMKITDYHDYEVEWDNDRSWPAAFVFSIIPKTR